MLSVVSNLDLVAGEVVALTLSNLTLDLAYHNDTRKETEVSTLSSLSVLLCLFNDTLHQGDARDG